MSAQYIDMTTSNAVLKELYDGQKVQNMVYKDNPMLAMVPKNPGAGGKYRPVPIQYGVSQGRSSTFATAQANQTGNYFKEFLVTNKKDYSIATLDNETMLSAKNDKQAFINVATNEVDSAIRVIKNSLGSAIFRSGTGSIGVISGSVSSGVITLATKADIVQFAVGQTLQCSATDGATPVAAKGYVISINKSAGTLTVSDTSISGSAGSPSGWSAGYFLLVDGDSNLKISGLAAWLPFTAPSSSAFFGVDRTADIVALGGNRYDASAQTISEGLQDALNEISLYGDGSTDFVMMNPNTYTNLVKSLGSKVQYIDLAVNAVIGFKGIVVDGPRGPVKILQDRNCPALYGYALQMDTWELQSLGDAPSILTYGKEGLEVLRVSTADAAELRVGYYGQLTCNAPGYNGVIKFAS